MNKINVYISTVSFIEMYWVSSCVNYTQSVYTVDNTSLALALALALTLESKYRGDSHEYVTTSLEVFKLPVLGCVCCFFFFLSLSLFLSLSHAGTIGERSTSLSLCMPVDVRCLWDAWEMHVRCLLCSLDCWTSARSHWREVGCICCLESRLARIKCAEKEEKG